MRKSITCLILFCLLPYLSIAQVNIPERGEVFRTDIVPKIFIEMESEDLDSLIAPGNEFDNDPYNANMIFDNGVNQDSVENIGIRLRGNTSRTAAKKSLKLDINAFEDQGFYGLEKMNINGEHNDPSVSRSRICWEILRRFDIPGSRANHVDLYINGDYIGVFANVEHYDENWLNTYFDNDQGNLYKCIYPADLNYQGSNPSAYQQPVFGRRPYDLRTNEDRDDYRDLAEFVDVLNNTSIDNLACELEKVLNVESLLKCIAFDVMTGNWDGPHYNKNNFYLYQNPATGRFEYIPYDLDNTLGIDWLNRDWGDRDIYDWAQHGDTGRPLYNRVLSVPVYRERYSRYLNELIEYFSDEAFFPYLDDIRDQIQEGVNNDIVYPLDYGFSAQDFLDSWDTDLGYFQTDYSIKDFVNTRVETALNQLEITNTAPSVIYLNNNYPLEGEPLVFRAQIEDESLDLTVNLCYIESGVSVCEAMQDDGMNDDGEADDGVYGLVLSEAGNAEGMEYFLEVSDASGQMNRVPSCDNRLIQESSNTSALVINEIMASNELTIQDQAQEFEDYIELYNAGNAPVSLGEYYITDNLRLPGKWRLPEVTLLPGEYYLLFADNDQDQGENHSNFKLSASGEEVGLFRKTADAFTAVDIFAYPELNTDEAYARIPNGTGDLVVFEATPDGHNEGLSDLTNLSDSSFSFYPNPASTEITLIKGSETDFPVQVQISDCHGKLLKELIIEAREQKIDCNFLNSGVYFFKTSIGGKNVASEKIVILK